MAKFTDDPKAKFKIWAREAKVYAFPRVANLPRFGVKRFRSYAEMNAWKRELLAELARQGGARWTR
jgi:hypothetical protein